MEKEKQQQPYSQVKMPCNGGIVTAALWRHQDDQGRPWYTVSLSRGRKDAASGKWVYEEFFSRDELLGLLQVIQVAHYRIVTEDVPGGANHE